MVWSYNITTTTHFKKPSGSKKPILKEDSSLKTKSPKEYEPTFEVVFQQVVSTKDHELASIDSQDEPQVEMKEESKEDIKLESNEVDVLQVDCVLFSSNIHSVLLPQQLEDPQNEVYIIEFKTSTATSSCSNFFKPEEYDAGAYHVKKKKLEDYG